jgi:hypothetical protein
VRIFDGKQLAHDFELDARDGKKLIETNIKN